MPRVTIHLAIIAAIHRSHVRTAGGEAFDAERAEGDGDEDPGAEVGGEGAKGAEGVAQKLSTKPNHLAKLETALGLGTLTPEQINGATSGFKNFGQLNAVVNTTLNNPNVEFAELKGLMTGLDLKGQPIAGQTTTYSLG